MAQVHLSPPTSHFNNLSLSSDSINDNDYYNYNSIPFTDSDKLNQIEVVMNKIDNLGFIPDNLIESEVKFFYENLGIDNNYFLKESTDSIVSNIHALYSAKLLNFINNSKDNSKEDHFSISHKIENDDHAIYIGDFDERIDQKYLDNSDSAANTAYRLESFSSNLSSFNNLKLNFVYKCNFTDSDKNNLFDSTFDKIASPETKKIYINLINQLKKTNNPVITHYNILNTNTYRIIIALNQKTSSNYSSSLSNLCHYYNLNLSKKYVEQFKNGTTIISLYVSPSSDHPNSNINLSINQVLKEASLLYSIPKNLFQENFKNHQLSLQECIYAHCGVIFVTHFLNRLGPEYNTLKQLLSSSSPSTSSLSSTEVLLKLKNRLTSETFSQNYIKETFQKHYKIIQRLYRHFADIHYIQSGLEKTLSFKRLEQLETVEDDAQFNEILSRYCSSNETDILVLKSLYNFNKSILKTNFFLSSKVAISFRLNPTFLPESEYPNKPFGLFFVVGSEFRGFHIRFKDIARGGIRIVLSRSPDNYNTNLRNLIDENYNLASTQQRKNKDIPEGGSKGVILLDYGVAQTRPKASFDKYIDAVIDLLIKPVDESKSNQIVDLYKKPEILFMGPDENTAGFVDWATLHAKKRGAPWWKSFFTGKSPTIGGIPHDEYGMTTLSVRAFVDKIYAKLNVQDTSSIRKVQTGGPSGDLGSNEIRLSDEKYVAVIDGPAVVGDPNGLDRTELGRLARERLDLSHFDKSTLSDKGFFVKADDTDIVLPNGLKFLNGIVLRNTAHLKLKELVGDVDLFVPCGGRPAAIDTNNVGALIDKKTGKAVIPYIVEGANLFITQDAKIVLEKAGAYLFKDASTNKGGVTSSSLEVLASLAFNDADFLNNMCANSEGKVPEFYKEYVENIQKVVINNANLEFDMLWKLKQETGKTFSELSDDLSIAINKLGDDLAASKELWDEDTPFRNAVLIDAFPRILLTKAGGIEGILSRVPEAYLKAIFATHLSSQYVYSRGIDSNPARFLEYISSLRKQYIKEGILAN
ncbi:glutamate dehydrogenase (NAD(+)) [Ascoidea rubescens DSM 1968]|uniref:NAD-specific glutamate dehydrogenase n=1 Tax=Ascoidea rubescens DSM 1968 TaxID=1344418 RepID=A0A1D2VHS1_9ASCO|nr:NAD-specific glutamate dehydrogenase [Ascoidea rubescens DSM 1968]ODV61027.1 NAD-specific glutamate dehydrogenase [Ascoidea rubescens DSM 1968]